MKKQFLSILILLANNYKITLTANLSESTITKTELPETTTHATTAITDHDNNTPQPIDSDDTQSLSSFHTALGSDSDSMHTSDNDDDTRSFHSVYSNINSTNNDNYSTIHSSEISTQTQPSPITETTRTQKTTIITIPTTTPLPTTTHNLPTTPVQESPSEILTSQETIDLYTKGATKQTTISLTKTLLDGKPNSFIQFFRNLAIRWGILSDNHPIVNNIKNDYGNIKELTQIQTKIDQTIQAIESSDPNSEKIKQLKIQKSLIKIEIQYLQTKITIQNYKTDLNNIVTEPADAHKEIKGNDQSIQDILTTIHDYALSVSQSSQNIAVSQSSGTTAKTIIKTLNDILYAAYKNTEQPVTQLSLDTLPEQIKPILNELKRLIKIIQIFNADFAQQLGNTMKEHAFLGQLQYHEEIKQIIPTLYL